MTTATGNPPPSRFARLEYVNGKAVSGTGPLGSLLLSRNWFFDAGLFHALL